VVNTGLRKTVFVDRGNGYLEPRAVVTGDRVGDRIEIVSGLKPGESVVASGAFLIDSEAQLKNGGEHD
jgi:Cu(I)/Ag(I) efflux system membrane fusion protein